jgi:dCTP deaminase
MILGKESILENIEDKNIVIQPFELRNVGANSYDVHLSKWLKRYWSLPLDCKKENHAIDIEIPEEGYELCPNKLYLGSTIEYTESHGLVPILHGKSSLGRLGLSIHVTAGFGDNGFCGHWTLELFALEPLRIYAGMPIGQICWHTTDAIEEYGKRPQSKYQNQGAKPVESQFYKNF